MFDDTRFGDIALDDDMFDVQAVADGLWVPGPYGPGDVLGTYNEVTPEKTAAALATLDLAAPVHTFNLSETVFNGFPTFGDRSHRLELAVAGYVPSGEFDGIIQRREPLGQNRLSSHEERVATTYNIGSKINGLLHCGVGDLFYNGFTGDDIARTWGAAQLDNVSWGPPITTRGFLIDVAALKAEAGTDTFTAANGKPVLRDNYRITLEDLHAAIDRQGLPEFEPGDAVLVRTGWNNLVRSDRRRFRAASPGPWLRETRWLATHRPALLGIDTWNWTTLDADTVQARFGLCHQELCMRFGIRFGEGIGVEELADAGVDQFVFCHNPLRAEGATASSSPALAIGNLK